jgi:hypothetical protein
LERIKKGKKYLEGELDLSVLTFIPPWNSYDGDTIRALKNAGIRNLSGNRYGPALKGPDAMILQYIPITIELHQIYEVVRQARNGNTTGATVAVLLHPYDFKESGDKRGNLTIVKLREVLAWLRSQADITLMSISQAGEKKTYDYRRFIANQPSILENVFPPFIKRTYDEGIYTSLKDGKKRRLEKSLLTIICFCVVGIVAITGGKWFSAILKTELTNYFPKELIFATSLALVVLCLILLRKPSFKKLSAIIFLLSVLMWGVLN